jgi:hemerythrin
MKGIAMLIVWTNDLNTGIEVIDNQHKRIVDYINQLADAIQQLNRLAVGPVLDELVDYTVSHFAFEESLQEEAGYELAPLHKTAHDRFAKRVVKYQERHNAGEDIAIELHSMLNTWLVHHIKRDDMAYASEVKASIHGIISDRENKKDGGLFERFFK